MNYKTHSSTLSLMKTLTQGKWTSPKEGLTQVHKSDQLSVASCSKKLQIQKNRNTTEEVKDTVCIVSCCSGVSVSKA